MKSFYSRVLRTNRQDVAVLTQTVSKPSTLSKPLCQEMSQWRQSIMTPCLCATSVCWIQKRLPTSYTERFLHFTPTQIHTHTRVCEPFYLDHKKYFCGNKTIDTYAISRSSGTAKKRKIKSQCVPQIKFLSLTRVSSDNLRRPAEQQPLNFNVNFVKILYIDTQSTTFTSSLLVWFDFAT